MAHDWQAMSWLNPPPHWHILPDGSLEVVSAHGGDFWCETQYGFVRDTGHALLLPAPREFSFTVTLRGEYRELYDQAGLMLRTDARHWVKCGTEFVGHEQWSVVVTQEKSDWSMQPGAEQAEVTFRCIRRGDALIFHARAQHQPKWTLLRVAAYPPDLDAQVGVMACSPEREGLRVTFLDAQLHSVDCRPLHQLLITS